MDEENQHKLQEIVNELREIRKDNQEQRSAPVDDQMKRMGGPSEKEEETAQNIDDKLSMFPKWLQSALNKNRKDEAADRKKEKGPRKVKDKDEKDPLGFLKDSFPKLFDKLDMLSGDKKKGKKDADGKSWLSKLLGPGAMLLISGLAALVAAFSGFGGPWKGLLESFGKWGTMGGLKLIGNTFKKMLGSMGKFLAKFLRRIPIVGGLVSFGFAAKAFANEDYLGGVLDIVSGVLNLLPFGFTQVLSFGVDMFNAWLDYKNQPDESGKKPGKLNIIKEMCAPIWDFIKPYAHNIPIIGTFMYASEAKDAFKGGEIGKGIWKMFGAFSSLIPFIGPMLHQGASALLGFTDEDFEAAKEGKPSKGISMTKMMKEWAIQKLAKGWKKMPWWVQKPLRAVMPDAVLKMLDSGAIIKNQPESSSETESLESAKRTKEGDDKGPKRSKVLNKSDHDLRQMTTNDLRNLRDEHGTDWSSQDYDRIQSVIEDRASGKSYDKQSLGPGDKENMSFSDKMTSTYLSKFKESGLIDSSGNANYSGQMAPPEPIKMAEGGLVKGGSGVRDDVPALLKAGEFVSTKETVSTLGAEFFENQNRATSRTEAENQSSSKQRDKLSRDMLEEIKQTNELQKTSIRQQQELAKIHTATLEATKELLNKEAATIMNSNTSTNVNMSSGGSIRSARDMSGLPGRHR
jgi:hypothetical protein